jgi:transcription initiation factor TFIID subunit 8
MFFLVIGCTPQFPNYLSALLPQDQIFDSDSDLEVSPVKKKKEKEPENKSKDANKEGILCNYFYMQI